MVASSGKRRRPERSHAATMATTTASSSGSTAACRAAMTSYSVVVTRVGASSILIAGVESLSLWCMGDLPPVLGVACAVSCALDRHQEEQKACQAAVASGQGSRWGQRHAVRRASTTQRRTCSVRRAVGASHRDAPQRSWSRVVLCGWFCQYLGTGRQAWCTLGNVRQGSAGAPQYAGLPWLRMPTSLPARRRRWLGVWLTDDTPAIHAV